MYPILPFSERVAARDTMIPLGEPIIGSNGTKVHQIPVKKGQFFILSHKGYNWYAGFLSPLPALIIRSAV